MTMIHGLQSFALLSFVLGASAAVLYGVISLARRVNWRLVPGLCWTNPSVVPLLLVYVLIPLEFAWVSFGLIVDSFGKSHFTHGHLYNSTLNGMNNLFAPLGVLMFVLFAGEQGYVCVLKPLLQKVKAAMRF